MGSRAGERPRTLGWELRDAEGSVNVWNNQGDTATLLDESGDVIDTQTYGSRQSSLENPC